LVFGILFVLAYYISAFSTWELPVDEIAVGDINEKRSAGEAFVQDFKAYISTLKIKSFRQHLYIYLLSFTGKDIYNTVFTYFCVYVLGVGATVAANMLSLSIVGVVTTLIGGWLMVKFGPRFLYVFSYGLMLIMYGGYFMVAKTQPSHIVTWLFVISFVYQIGRSLLEFTPWNVYPFIPDIDELVSGHNRAGVFASVISLTRNSTAAIATVLVGMFLDANGFVKNASSEPVHVQQAIMQAIFIGAGGLILLALLVALTFKLNRHTHKVIIDEVQRLRNGGAKHDATEETKKVVKELTGYDYSRVWPESPETVNPPIVLQVDKKENNNK
jgi:oligogalacturonide transporter